MLFKVFDWKTWSVKRKLLMAQKQQRFHTEKRIKCDYVLFALGHACKVKGFVKS